jgi:hypothetical protein
MWQAWCVTRCESGWCRRKASVPSLKSLEFRRRSVWLFFKARAKCPYLSHTGRASNAEKQPTGRGPEGCVENGPAAALLVGYVSFRYAPLAPVRLGPPCRRPILNATKLKGFKRRYTSPLLAKGPKDETPMTILVKHNLSASRTFGGEQKETR